MRLFVIISIAFCCCENVSHNHPILPLKKIEKCFHIPSDTNEYYIESGALRMFANGKDSLVEINNICIGDKKMPIYKHNIYKIKNNSVCLYYAKEQYTLNWLKVIQKKTNINPMVRDSIEVSLKNVFLIDGEIKLYEVSKIETPKIKYDFLIGHRVKIYLPEEITSIDTSLFYKGIVYYQKETPTNESISLKKYLHDGYVIDIKK